MSKQPVVILWSKQGCHYCEEVKGYFRERRILFEEIDITDHDSYRDILDVKYGVRHVPVVEIGGNGVYKGVTELGIESIEKALAH